MEANRILTQRAKPSLILDKRFSFTKNLNFGDHGQIVADIEIEGKGLIQDSNGDEMLALTLRVINAELFNPKKVRLA